MKSECEDAAVRNTDTGDIFHEYGMSVEELENAVCEADTENAAGIADVENALCERDRGGTENG